MAGEIIRIGDIKTKKIEAIKDADIYIGLAESAKESSVPMSVGVYKQIGGPVDVVYAWDEITIVTDGPMEATIDGKKHICNVGDILITKKGTKVTLNAPASGAGIFVTFPHLEEALKGSPLEGAL